MTQPTPEMQLLVDEVLSTRTPRCGNCGAEDKLRVHLIVPPSQGGKYVASNAILLCGVCARQALVPPREGDMQYVNFWTRRASYNRLRAVLDERHIASVNAVARALIERFVALPDAYPDLDLYVEQGVEVKVTLRLEVSLYQRFKELVTGRRMTVTDAMKALLNLYLENPADVRQDADRNHQSDP